MKVKEDKPMGKAPYNFKLHATEEKSQYLHKTYNLGNIMQYIVI